MRSNLMKEGHSSVYNKQSSPDDDLPFWQMWIIISGVFFIARLLGVLIWNFFGGTKQKKVDIIGPLASGLIVAGYLEMFD